MDPRSYDFDDLEVYDGIMEAVQDEDYTFGDLAEEYGAFEAVNLTRSGTIADHSEQELVLRESRVPDAEMQAAYINDGLRDAAKNAARAVSSMSLPGVTGFMAVESGGDPVWVSGAIASTAIVSENVKRGALMAKEGVSRHRMKKDFEREYRLEKVAEEDYDMDIVSDSEYNRKIMDSSGMDNVDVRDHGVVVSGRVEEAEEVEEEEFDGDVLEPDLEPEDDEFE